MHRLAVQRACASRAGHVRAAAYLQSTLVGSRLRIGSSVYVVAARGMRTKIKEITPPITLEEAEKKLRENETVSELIKLGPGIFLQHHANIVASNPLCEDRITHSIVNDRIYYACIDGHAGVGVSALLTDTLIPRVDEALQKLGPEKIKDDKQVESAIQEAFISLDSDIIHQPIAILHRELEGAEKDAEKKLNRTPEQAKEIDMAFQLAMMGACVVLAVLDPYHNRLHIATTGDSRAVMGTWNPEVQLWDVSQLSEDQTSVNPKEAKRLTSEHPPREAPEILKDGRTLGLGPSRAFGDAMFKWPRDAIRNVSRMIYPTPYEPIPEAKTPPYVTARPEVTSREILPEDALEQGMRRFIVLGTDGLYETLTNSEIVGLVGGALQTEPPKGEIAKEAIRETTQLAAHPEGTYFSEPGYGRNYKFIFEDQNLATHVIRNSIAGSHTKLLQTLLGLPKELSRNYRDDTSVVVIDIQAMIQHEEPLEDEPDAPFDLRSKLEAAAAKSSSDPGLAPSQ